MTKIFVYGTLKQGQCRAFALDKQQFLGLATTLPEYRIFNLGSYPGLVKQQPGKPISGEVWEIDADCLEHLDMIEGVDFGEYRREPILLSHPFAGEIVLSYFYCKSVAGYPDCGTCW